VESKDRSVKWGHEDEQDAEYGRNKKQQELINRYGMKR
jgi:hypothetical protein